MTIFEKLRKRKVYNTPENKRESAVEFYEQAVKNNNSLVNELRGIDRGVGKRNRRIVMSEYDDWHEEVAAARQDAERLGVNLPVLEVLTYMPKKQK